MGWGLELPWKGRVSFCDTLVKLEMSISILPSKFGMQFVIHLGNSDIAYAFPKLFES